MKALTIVLFLVVAGCGQSEQSRQTDAYTKNTSNENPSSGPNEALGDSTDPDEALYKALFLDTAPPVTTGTVVGVLNGTTIVTKVGNAEVGVRLACVETDNHVGAIEVLTELLLGQVVELEEEPGLTAKVDEEGNVYRYVWLDSTNVNAEMIRQDVATYDNSLGEAYRHEQGFREYDLSKNEIVMSPGMTITATTPEGAISVVAGPGLERSYTWDGATRRLLMFPRAERWYGSLGLYNPGTGNHWVDHNGISRGVVEEGHRHFETVEEVVTWVKERTRIEAISYVYTDDGLVVGWSAYLPRKQLNVEVWQVLVNGEKPTELPGKHNDAITITTP